jgi:hypothetical protein
MSGNDKDAAQKERIVDESEDRRYLVLLIGTLADLAPRRSSFACLSSSHRSSIWWCQQLPPSTDGLNVRTEVLPTDDPVGAPGRRERV